MMQKLIMPLLVVLALNIGCNSTQSTKANTQKAPADVGQTSPNFMGDYTIDDATFGTKTVVTIKGDKRLIVTNGLPNHKTGAFPNSGNPNRISAQNLKYEIPMNPVFTGKPKWAREPGVCLNGVKLEPETAEAFVCETGERYRIEAFQNLVNLGLDFNNAHVQPTGAYHYHGVPMSLVELLDKGQDMIHIGFAKDGYPIYYSKSGKYKPSFRLAKKSRTGDVCNYNAPGGGMKKALAGTSPDGTFVSDWEYVKDLGDLDECNGTTVDGKYIYLATKDYPYLGRCLMGEFAAEERPKGPPPGGRPGGPPPGGGPGGPPPGGGQGRNDGHDHGDGHHHH